MVLSSMIPAAVILMGSPGPANSETVQESGFADAPQLSARLQDGDEAAFAWLHRMWSRRINRYCFAIAGGDANFAAEVSQATWLRLVRHARVVKDEQALWNWIAKAARCAAADLRRRGGRYMQVLRRFAEWWGGENDTDAPDGDGALLSALDAALGKLGPDERLLIEGRYFAGDSLEAIGVQLSLSIRAVEGRLARLRVRLRELVSEELQQQPQ